MRNNKSIEAPAKCPICGAASVYYCLKTPANYFRCPQCETIFQHPLPTVERMMKYADQEYAEGLYEEYVQARDLKYLTFCKRMASIESRSQGTRVVDIGCACGYFIEVALEHGFDAYGIEFSSVAIASASEQVRSRIIQQDVNQLDTKHRHSFDLVTAFDVIEHTLEPIKFLVNSRSLLKSRGLLVITTPDVGHFLRRVMRSGWPMLQPFQHTVLFSSGSLRAALERGGYTDIEILPARKILTPDYLVTQIEQYNPFIARAYNALSGVLPAKLRQLPVSINIGEIMAFARSGD